MSDKQDKLAAGSVSKRLGRRRFLSDTAKTGAAVLLTSLGLGAYASKSAPLPLQALRPPGARPEKEFLGACIRCGCACAGVPMTH